MSTTPALHVETAIELARLRTELHATNAVITRIAAALENTLRDHEARLRAVEAVASAAQSIAATVAKLEARAQALEAASQRQSGAVKVLYALATLPAGLWFVLARGGK